jgi:hypothetical protein
MHNQICNNIYLFFLNLFFGDSVFTSTPVCESYQKTVIIWILSKHFHEHDILLRH